MVAQPSSALEVIQAQVRIIHARCVSMRRGVQRIAEIAMAVLTVVAIASKPTTSCDPTEPPNVHRAIVSAAALLPSRRTAMHRPVHRWMALRDELSAAQT